MLRHTLLGQLLITGALTVLVSDFCLEGVGHLNVARAASDEPDILVADFEGSDYGTWRNTGRAFGPGPARGTLPNQMHVEGFLGKRLVNSYHEGDGTTGTLTSPPLRIERQFVQFLIGGGNHPGKTCINLKVGDQVVRTATGPNDRPGGSERLEWTSWDVRELIGQEVVFEVVDQETGGWGHINIDHIIQTNQRLPGVLSNARRAIVIEKRFLNLPVKNGATKRRVSLLIDDKTAQEFEIELADGKSERRTAEPDFWVFLDLGSYSGKQAMIQVDRLPEDSRALELIEQSDSIRDSETLYRESLRPQWHFSSRRGWNNDPNGLVYFQGEYHLYYQHNPYGWSWGNMHWGHAVSRDLVHWQELPIAIYPRQFGDWVFSGSAIVDWKNSSGFSSLGGAVLVAAFTSTGRGECIVYSNDRGRTWQEYAGNPVVRHNGRDPRLLWHEPSSRWVMAVYDEHENGRYIAFYTSANLREWE